MMTSIRTKIFVGCISLTLVTVLVGVLTQKAQGQLSDTALGIYDNAFIPMSDLRSAQSIVLGVSRDLALGNRNNVVYVDQLQSALDALDVTRERAMSSAGEIDAKQLIDDVSDLQSKLREGTEPPSREHFRAVETKFDLTVQTYAGDGFRLRRSVQALVQKTRSETLFAMAASVFTAFLITIMLSRAIVPSIRHAVAIAASIAGGRLDNQIDQTQTSETGTLLRALSSMQHSIAEKIAFIETLMAQQASGFAAEIATQNARFKAALNNMSHGLCMFDASGTLLVHNRRFSDMFPSASDAAGVLDILPRLSAADPQGLDDPASLPQSFSRALEDGRIIAVLEEPMEGGGRVTTYEDITERRRTENRLSHMARHDALTGLPNRVLFREYLEEKLADPRCGVLAVLCVDLDRFKTVNDTLGHPFGDALLQKAATRLTEATRDADIVVRLGGDEFAIIRETSSPGDEVTELAESVIGTLSKPFDIKGHLISVGASIGVALTQSGADTPDDLLKNADLALYQAKADGRGTFRFFRAEMDDRVQAKRQVELDLRVAIAENQFELFYQPLVSARNGVIEGFEALVRWNHPSNGLVSPANFIPIAEETGLIVAIGDWVMTHACRDAMDWPEEIKIAINLSPIQFNSPDLVSKIAAALRHSGLAPTRLELEITESLMLQDCDMTVATLHDLRALGICISMDDFGTGYSSLSYLRRFPFDKIKIDRSFTERLEEGGDGLAIVKAVIELGHSLRMNVIAEGVETLGQMKLLREAGCKQMQGYIFSPPQRAATAKALISEFPNALGFCFAMFDNVSNVQIDSCETSNNSPPIYILPTIDTRTMTILETA